MYEFNDLFLLLKSQQALVNIQTNEEDRARDLVSRCSIKLGKEVLQWSVTRGVVVSATGQPRLSMRVGTESGPTPMEFDPREALLEISRSKTPGIYMLLDFHPFLDEPFIIRLIKEIAQDHSVNGHHLVFISHDLKIPAELSSLTAQFSLSLPDRVALQKLVLQEAQVWRLKSSNKRLQADREAIDLLAENLIGLTVADSQRLIRNAIYDDDAISKSDLERVQQAKYKLLGQNGVLNFEYETATFAQVGGLQNLKAWLNIRKSVFLGGYEARPSKKAAKGVTPPTELDSPKGIMLVGVQGSGKSLAAKAVAGVWGVPLLRLDFGTLYNKYFGETEKNMREAISLAEVMSPCVLWLDELEKGVSSGDQDNGTSQRLLATLLTWMAENKKPVFIVATANNIEALPPELIRKGRLDEIFFVDLPDAVVREQIFHIHLAKRHIDSDGMGVDELAQLSEGFSGAEIEQVVVSALYRAHAEQGSVSKLDMMNEIQRTQPLSVVMSESVDRLRLWAKDRTVMANASPDQCD
jgi:SpoVK/Ycf46/Vps4 family AAA+-type ATPase